MGLRTLCLLAIALQVAIPGCGSSSKGPRSALDDYGRALRSGNYAAAYELMSARFRDQHTKEEFVRMMKDNPREVGETASRLRSSAKQVEISAEFRYDRGDLVELVQEGGKWRIASNPVAFYSQATPRDALRSFVRAYRMSRWDIMLRFVPDKYREQMNTEKMKQQFQGENREDVDVMMKVLEANLEQPITDKGDEARMPFGDRYEVQFIREGGEWKIQDIE